MSRSFCLRSFIGYPPAALQSPEKVMSCNGPYAQVSRGESRHLVFAGQQEVVGTTQPHPANLTFRRLAQGVVFVLDGFGLLGFEVDELLVKGGVASGQDLDG